MPNRALIDKFHTEIVVECEASSCLEVFIPAEQVAEPIEAWAERAATEAERSGWSTSSLGEVLCSKCATNIKRRARKS
jgi:hypothetical protein